MLRTSIIFLLLAIISITVFSNSEEQLCADDILGTWVFPQYGFHVEVDEYNGKYYGTIVYCRDSADGQGNLKLDKKNPDPDLRERPYKGILVLKEIEYQGNGKFKHGTIYDPERGEHYNCIITLTSKTEARMRGYIALPLFGQTEYCFKLS